MLNRKYSFVYGAGLSGCGIAEVLANRGKQVILYNDSEKKIDSNLEKHLEINAGRYLNNEDWYPFLEKSSEIILSPGVDVGRNEIVRAAKELGLEIYGEAEAASRFYKGKMIGITGTNGKTTTTMLEGKIIEKLTVDTAIAGNIGVSLAKVASSLSKEAWLVAELSSFQLETVNGFFKPQIAIVLNLTPDHFDRHVNMEKYAKAKAKIFKNQTAEDVLILNYDDALVRSFSNIAKSKIFFISTSENSSIINSAFDCAYIEANNFVLRYKGKKTIVAALSDFKLFGKHNYQNALAAIAAAFFAGVAIDDIKDAIIDFKGVEDRLEYVTEISGVKYYNDTKATNPDSVIKALEAFEGKKVVLIAGGKDKFTDLEQLMECANKKTVALVLVGEARSRFYEVAKQHKVENIHVVDGSFKEGVELAKKLAKPGEVVLLSPACSSFDMFKNFPERGRCFKKIVLELAKKERNL